MVKLRTLGCMGLALLLTACATAKLTLSPTDLASLRIERVTVEFHEPASIWWGNAEREYLAQVQGQPQAGVAKVRKASLSQDEADEEARRIMASPEAQAYLRTKLSGLIRQRMERDVLPKYQGSRPAELVIVVHGFTIPSAIQRAVLGGNPMLLAPATLKDSKTGAELGKLDRAAAGMAGQGILGVVVDQAFSDLEDRVLDTYTQYVLQWLRGEQL